ncbi:hypothetical protein GUJ93_ZPchr0002g25641 [Zizania palustris]|uniref:Nin one binding (NOB1) Zn-ribbon-like domain-containing protein n=1 Tax=Zizania palustris TaxID=103762 RepID=A0A8J5SMJ2_ZIZPA|nr:hypothetical protein GUJ93_ZPchr0002g25641 [Zizania palustris]
MSEAGGDLMSRILPLKDLEDQEIPTSETNSISEKQGDEEHQPSSSKKYVVIVWEDDENNQGWLPAVSRNTHKRYLRRKMALPLFQRKWHWKLMLWSIKNSRNACIEELDKLDIKSETEEGVDSPCADDGNSGMQIRQLHRWVLRCHACYKVTQEIGKLFCPKSGNGGTLRIVSVTVGENGITMASRRPRVTLPATKVEEMPSLRILSYVKTSFLRSFCILNRISQASRNNQRIMSSLGCASLHHISYKIRRNK